MTKLLLIKNLTALAFFLSLAGTRPGYTSADRIALHCQHQQQTKIEYTAKWDMALEKTTLQMTEEEDRPSGPFSLLIDFKRNQAMYSEEGAWNIMNITANNANKINLLFEKDTELGSDINYIELDKSALSFKSKFILSWESTWILKTTGQCRIVRESDIKGFPDID